MEHKKQYNPNIKISTCNSAVLNSIFLHNCFCYHDSHIFLIKTYLVWHVEQLIRLHGFLKSQGIFYKQPNAFIKTVAQDLITTSNFSMSLSPTWSYALWKPSVLKGIKGEHDKEICCSLLNILAATEKYHKSTKSSANPQAVFLWSDHSVFEEL